MKFFLMLVPFFIQGCVVSYPVKKTLQPKVSIIVTDLENSPISDADVNLISSSYYPLNERHRMVIKTGTDGTVQFPKIREWRSDYLGVHGFERFQWNICVMKEGYETSYVGLDKSTKHETVVLKKGEGKKCRTIGISTEL